ncbi:MAG: RC-LH1 core complex protein PufX [Pseudomonadota bacterium]
MSDNKLDFEISEFTKKQLEVAWLMGKGAIAGGVIFFGIGIFLWLLVLLGETLPPESKEADDPTPWSSELVVPTIIEVT